MRLPPAPASFAKSEIQLDMLPKFIQVFYMVIGTHCDPLPELAELRADLAKLAKALPELARAQMHLKRSFLIKVYVRLVSPKKGYRRGAIGPGYLLVPLVWSGGTRRPHIGLGHHINFHSHFRPKMGIVKKYHEKSVLVPKHVSGVYKHHDTLKLCSESFYTLLQGGFRSFMRLNLDS